jgi:hypothetical protein
MLNELGANSVTHSSRLDDSNESRLVAIQAQAYGEDKVIISLRSGYDFSNVDVISSILGYPTEKKLIFTFPCRIKTSAALEALQDLQISEPLSSASNKLLSSAVDSSSPKNASVQDHQDDNPLSAYLEAGASVSAASASVRMIQKMVMPPIDLISKFANNIACKFKSVFNHRYKTDTNVVVEFDKAEDGFNFSQSLAKLGIVNAQGQPKAVGDLIDNNCNYHGLVLIMNRGNMNSLFDSYVKALGLEGYREYGNDQDLQFD